VSEAELERWLAARRALVERALAAHLPPGKSRLRQAMRYSLFAGGKRLRPVLVLAAAETSGGARQPALPFACAIEMIHTYSLVHDDLPAMDDDDLRRGRPTSHRVYGEGVAILVGDALLTEAFTVMARARGVAPARAVAAIAELAAAAGEAGMVGGQALDLAAEGGRPTLRQLRAIHDRKTGALFRAAVRVGGLIGGATPNVLRRLTVYDILDAAGDPHADGRTDRELEKATYPALLGLDGARLHLVRARDAALAAARPLGASAEPLRALAVHVAASTDAVTSAATG
jgi:geranylgeranyl diphosphate synthase type II